MDPLDEVIEVLHRLHQMPPEYLTEDSISNAYRLATFMKKNRLHPYHLLEVENVLREVEFVDKGAAKVLVWLRGLKG